LQVCVNDADLPRVIWIIALVAKLNFQDFEL